MDTNFLGIYERLGSIDATMKAVLAEQQKSNGRLTRLEDIDNEQNEQLAVLAARAEDAKATADYAHTTMNKKFAVGSGLIAGAITIFEAIKAYLNNAP